MVVRMTWASVPPDPQHHQARAVGEKKEEVVMLVLGYCVKYETGKKGLWFSYEAARSRDLSTTRTRQERGYVLLKNSLRNLGVAVHHAINTLYKMV